MHDCLEFLRMFPQLVHCKFHDIILDLDYPLLESPILNRLTHFSLFCHDISLDPFLDNIVLPSVGTLVPFHIDSMDPLMTFLERSVHCTPFRWSIWILKILTQLLQFLSPSLTELVIFPTLPNVEYLPVLTNTYISQSAVVGDDFLLHLKFFWIQI